MLRVGHRPFNDSFRQWHVNFTPAIQRMEALVIKHLYLAGHVLLCQLFRCSVLATNGRVRQWTFFNMYVYPEGVLSLANFKQRLPILIAFFGQNANSVLFLHLQVSPLRRESSSPVNSQTSIQIYFQHIGDSQRNQTLVKSSAWSFPLENLWLSSLLLVGNVLQTLPFPGTL